MSETENKRAPLSLPPRLHNTLSYSVTALVMAVLVDWSRPPVAAVAALWIAHFVRRTGESLYVHRYSGRAVPPGDWAVEYAYYWGFATWVALGISDPQWNVAAAPFLTLGGAVFLIGESGNAWAHLKLRALRERRGDSERSIPEGGLFGVVSCPHYLFEITSWVGFALVAQVWGAYAFLGLGAGILGTYAWQRHTAYKSEFDGADGRSLYPKDRRALVPFVF